MNVCRRRTAVLPHTLLLKPPVSLKIHVLFVALEKRSAVTFPDLTPSERTSWRDHTAEGPPLRQASH